MNTETLMDLDPDVYMSMLQAEHQRMQAERRWFVWNATRPLIFELALLGI